MDVFKDKQATFVVAHRMVAY
ncbi:hypothetical protein CBM2597_P30029 [Cupriavidus taiwanensis]|nr:hypothetical protein CBM2597_P30029 [Cupriavidus taiwanensis]